MSLSVRTIADPRVVSEDGIVFNQYVGPLNWEHYKIPASGLSNTQITFANLVTLGTNRIYDSSFQIEYTIELSFDNGGVTPAPTTERLRQIMRFHPFPMHWVTDQLRVNINGAACMTRPQENLLQRMMYWRQKILDKSCSYCPHTKSPAILDTPLVLEELVPVDQGMLNHQMKYGKNGSQNYGTPLNCVSFESDNSGTTTNIRITFREPVLCAPFNQRLDKIYQSPLFNITSIDIVYQLNNLRTMLENCDICDATQDATAHLTYLQNQAVDGLANLSPAGLTSINITSAQLCFNVASLPTGMTVPPMLNLPYYDNVCYVTNANVPAGTTGEVPLTSGVYTLAQVPTAIYIFVGPNQLYRSEGQITNKLDCGFCPIRDINITMGNNTQILTTTSEFDRYQMALANGLEDVTWEEFTQSIIPLPNTGNHGLDPRSYNEGQHSCKCILRLIPGVDLLIPDRRLVGGTDAEQMVFQVRLTADVTGIPDSMQPYLALWIMFEYCGILTIEPVHASIDMLPLKTIPPIGDIELPSQLAENATGGGEGTNPRGAGIWDLIKTGYRFVKGAWNSRIGKKIRGVADSILSGEAPATKMVKGGSIIGGGDFYD